MNDRGRGTTGAIIAGGAATRFGGLPKGLEVVGGIRLIDRVAGSLRGQTDSLLIAANDASAADWIPGAAVARDILPVAASVTGIHAALAAAGGNIVAVAWDMPFVPASLIGELGARLTNSTMAVVPRPARGAEPLCAAYAGAAAAVIARLVGGGTTRLAHILAQLGPVTWLEEADLRRFGDPEIMFFNVNSPEDFDRANVIARSL